MQKLNQVIAVEKSIKSKVKHDQDVVYKAVQKPELFSGFQKTYHPKEEQGEQFPPESRKVQFIAREQVEHVARRQTDLFDVTLTKDTANCAARIDLAVDGEILLKGAPVTFLLFLEKEITDMRTFLDKLPVLDNAEDWILDQGAGIFKTAATQTMKTRKEQKPLVLYPATDKHPAQTQIITEDVVAGTWNTIKMSGAVPENWKKAIVAKAEKLLIAIKKAREEANNTPAPEQSAAGVMGWLLK
jgi:hypothetical protein